MESEVEILCSEKEQELLDKYFGNLAKETALESHETIGEYTKDLLMVMRHDFLEEITGKHINCKAFED